jgi:hypothetical protein
VNGCCTSTRREDGIIDTVNVERAMQGLTTSLTRRERTLTVWRLHNVRGWGLDRISQHLGYSRSSVAEILASARGNG